MLQQHFWKIVGLIVIALVGAAFLYSNHVSSKANEGIVLEDHLKGNPEASVTLTEYSDFQCPACREFAPVVAEVLAQYGDQIRFEYKHFPLITIHPHAVAAARAAEAAGQQGKFFEMHDKLFAEQSAWSTGPNPNTYFTEYAEELGLDVALFKRHLRASLLRDRVMAGYNEAREHGLSGTPSFFLNGQKMEIKTYDDFTNQIAAAVTGVDNSDASSTIEVAPASGEVQFGF